MRTVDTLDIADDPLPAEVRTRYGLQPQLAAWHGIHRPVEFADIPSPPRLRPKRTRRSCSRPCWPSGGGPRTRCLTTPRIRGAALLEAFDARLPSSLTKGQLTRGRGDHHRAVPGHPMHRPLQG
jgi:ATP-dependent DNA helicase RecG